MFKHRIMKEKTMQNAQRKTSTLKLFTQPAARSKISAVSPDKQIRSDYAKTLMERKAPPALLEKEKICRDMATD